MSSAPFTILRQEGIPLEPASGTVRMAAVQMEPRLGDAEHNLAVCEDALVLAKGEGAALAAFPECALTGYCYQSREEALEHALPADGPELTRLAGAAAERGMHAAVGYLERTPEGNLANAVSIVGPGGRTAHYRKTHLPFLGVDKWVTPGDEPFRVFEAAGLRVGLLICYDASFPEAVRLLALAGADLVLLPTNWPQEAIAKAAWLPNTRAYENVIYFASVNRLGNERGYVFHGLSRVCGPTGETLVEGPRDAAAILITDLDPERARNKRIERRGDAYWVDRIGQRRKDLYVLRPAGDADRS